MLQHSLDEKIGLYYEKRMIRVPSRASRFIEVGGVIQIVCRWGPSE